VYLFGNQCMLKRDLFFTGLLVLVSLNAVANDNKSVVESFLRKAEEVNVEGYKPDEASRISVKQAFDNRKALTSDELTVVEGIQEQLHSDEFKRQQEAWRKQLGEVMGTDAWVTDNTDSPTKVLPYSERPLLFISSSMPMRTLRTYAQSLEGIGGVMVLRGFVDGMDKVGPTLRFVSNILKIDEDCTNEPCARRQVQVLIDPIIYREYGIKSVPAFTVHDVTNLDAYCKGTKGLNPASVVVYGDNSIEYLAQRFAKDSGRSIERLLREVKGQ